MPDTPLSQRVPQFVGDNLALDFINTQYGVGSAHQECLVDDASVVGWLKLAKVLPMDCAVVPKGLLKLAMELRASAELLLTAARSGQAARADMVNRVLETGRPVRELEWNSASASFQWVVRRPREDAPSLLEPVAQALAELLTDTQLELVRQCEAHDCTLWFHDLTKSHRRRWCSMAVCGNRMKVAAFRSRQSKE